MSPPQVNLAVKDQPIVSDEELPMEKEEKTEIPIVVTVETERIRVQRATFQAKRRRRVACCMSLIVVVLVAASAAIVFGMRHRFHHHRRHHHRDHWTCNSGNGRLPEHVQVDHQNHLIHVHHEHADENQPAVHILHEYGRRMAAFKDIDNNICYITRLDETFEEGYARWESYEHAGRDPKTLRVLTQHRVEMLVLQHVTDVHIYAHCRNAVSYWAVEIEEREVTTAMTIVRV